MPEQRPEILMEKLIRNQISSEELNELLSGISNEKSEYYEFLEKYFEEILKKLYLKKDEVR